MSNGFTLSTPEQISVYQALCVKHGLQAITKGFRINRAYTPKNCMAMATKITGEKFKARDYEGAIKALEGWIENARALRS